MNPFHQQRAAKAWHRVGPVSSVPELEDDENYRMAPKCKAFTIPKDGSSDPQAPEEADLDSSLDLKDQGKIFDIEDFGIKLSAGLTCPKHDWSFDLFTGKGDRGNYSLKIWEIQLREPAESGDETPITQSPREKKRKRKSESGEKKQKKHKLDRTEESEGEGDQNNEQPISSEENEKPDLKATAISSTTQNDLPETPNSPDNDLGLNKKGQPRKARGSRIGGKNKTRVGFYTKDEVEKLEGHKVAFCNLHSITDHKVFDAMVQHSERTGIEHRSEYDWPCSADECTKNEFWAEIYDLIPDRDRRSLYRFMRRHFQDSTQKPHVWTPEQDDELIQLMTLHPGKWSYVARQIGRSDDDVTQRWKNQLEHRGKMNRGKWNAEEVQMLLDVIQETWNKIFKEQGSDAGKDMYEMDDRILKWGVISDALGNVRSRQQCADKWRKVRKYVESLRAAGNPDAQYDPIEAINKASRWSLSAPGTPKSTWNVVEDDDDDDLPDSKFDQNASELGTARGGFAPSTQTPEPNAKPFPSSPGSGPQSDAGDEPTSPALPFTSSLPQSSPSIARRADEDEGSAKNEKEAKRAAAAASETSEESQKSSKKRKQSLDATGTEAVTDENVAPGTPQKKKKKKSRKSVDANADVEKTPKGSSKKSKKHRQSNGPVTHDEAVDIKLEGHGTLSD
ncbi:hypothetical protein N7478_009561 [Penicillium angulare]|uniref:uncharacterized protein n=1 Tax=Penicillium angulare TaxID=116970 RepID=UPI002540F393|nr:uncharacterized protein N7478_009561 [Penicillium angulare]KAJ5266753.1 hypothetical protein N7478_009561 [Penicillium angulare]